MTRLTSYSKKRNFNDSTEPRARIKKSTDDLIFVIQKHDARRLHFDLRLELDGVLKSWAVPKGAPTSKNEKRLAIMVEDHPYEYRKFAGTIPAGNYGAGTVEIWDSGTYSIAGATTRAQTEKLMRAGLKKGHLNFILHGKKLQAAYSLIRTSSPSGTKESWLWLTKEESPRDEMPTRVTPMLAKKIDEPFDDKDWLFEIKWDGYRSLARIKSHRAELISRNQKSLNEQFGIIKSDLEKYLDHDALFDGEIVAVDNEGRPSFEWLQNYRQRPRGHLLYYVFDVLYFDGYDLRSLPLSERKALLQEILAPLSGTHIRYSDHIEKDGKKFFKQAQNLGLEGIIAKDSKGQYLSTRSGSWLKIKTHHRQEMVIGGFTEARSTRKFFGALLLGFFDEDNALHYAGHVGSGFSDETLRDLAKKMRALIRKTCPFAETPRTNTPATYVRPVLVVEIAFSEWTKDGRLRHPVFVGLRNDKDAREVRKE